MLLSPPGTANPYLAEFGWVAAKPGDVKVPGPQTLWKASDGPLTPSNPVTLTWDNGQGLAFTRTISVDPNYMFTVRDTVRNNGSAPAALVALRPGQSHRHAAGRRLLHSVRRPDRLPRRIATGGQIFLAEPPASRSTSHPPAVGSVSPTSTG